MEFNLINFLIGGHASIVILIVIAFIFGGGIKSNKKSDWIIFIGFLVFWELAIIVTLVKSWQKNKQKRNMTNEEIIEGYRKEISKADNRLKRKLESFDKFEEHMLSEYGIKQTSKEKWIIAIRNWHTDKVSDLIIKINKLEKRGN